MEPSFADTHHDSGQERFNTYVKIAMILSVITGVEILIIFLPLAKWFVITTLVVLSFVKFMYVIFYFMHLRWDKVFCTILFFIGLILASGTMWALLQLFGSQASVVPTG